MDLTHLDALRTGLAHERARLAAAKKPQEIAMRQVWVRGYEREIEQEYEFLGIAPLDVNVTTNDDDLLAELG